MVVLIGSETKLIKILNDLNKFCDNLGIKINEEEKCIILGDKMEKINISIRNEVLVQLRNLRSWAAL